MKTYQYILYYKKAGGGGRTDFIAQDSANIYRGYHDSSNWFASGLYHTKFTTTTGVWVAGATGPNGNNIKKGDRIPFGHDSFAAHSVDIKCDIYDGAALIISIPLGNFTTQKVYGVCDWYRRTMEKPTPSYLETLDKLDQWSSAQYIPNSGNKLNL